MKQNENKTKLNEKKLKNKQLKSSHYMHQQRPYIPLLESSLGYISNDSIFYSLTLILTKNTHTCRPLKL